MPSFNQFTLNLLTALLVGTIIGIERQYRQHPAGLRTNALVAVGAALFMSLSHFLERGNPDLRIAGQIVSGLGFLGGGVILREGMTVRGLNTAATLWCTGALGAMAGSGLAAPALAGTAVILCINVTFLRLVKLIDRLSLNAPDIDRFYQFQVVCNADQTFLIRESLLRRLTSRPGMSVHGIATKEADRPDRALVTANVNISQQNDAQLNELLTEINLEPGVTSIRWDRVH